MGEGYRARDSRLGREVALKVLPKQLLTNREGLLRFAQEARSASSLNHPNIVTSFEVGTVDSSPFIAMELIDGHTLRDLLQPGRLPIRKTLEIAAQIADGLGKAHQAGIVHRDLKPENIMITRDGFAKILDFGVAKLQEPLGLILQVNATDGLRLSRVRLAGGAPEPIPFSGTLRLVPSSLSPAAVGADGRIAVAVTSGESWYRGVALLDPTTGVLERIPVAFDGDIHFPAWSRDGSLIAVGTALRSPLWRFRVHVAPAAPLAR